MPPTPFCLLLRRRCYAPLLALTLSLAPLGCVALPNTETTTRMVAPGIVYTQEITTGDAPQVLHILRVDLRAPGVKVRCGQAQDAVTLNGATKGRERIHSLAARNQALAAVNADFFPFTGDPLGLAIRDGELVSEPLGYRACLGLGPKGVVMDVLAPVGTLTLANGDPIPLDGINRFPNEGEIVALTPTYAAAPRLDRPATVVTLRADNLPVRVSQEVRGTVESVVSVPAREPLPVCPSGAALLAASGSAAGSLAARCKEGDALAFRFDLVPSVPQPPARGQLASRAGFVRRRALTPSWTDIEQAVGGGPWLVRDGQIVVDGEAEGFQKAEFIEKRHPRTAAGVAADGTLLLVAADGRAAWSRGVSLGELAGIMKRLGAVNAINLDGGGSTTMVVGGGVVNAPSDGRERPVANGLLVYGRVPDTPVVSGLQIRPNAPDGVALQVGESVTFTVTDADGKPLDPARQPLWGTGDGLGFITQRGVFTSRHAGSGTVTARVGTQQLAVPVRIVSGPPALLKPTLGSVPNNPPDRNLLTVTARDRFGNPSAGQKITVQIRGGELLSPLITDANGQASAEIVWDAAPGQRILTVSAGNAPPVTLRR
ncbi:MAG TPA: phosphodiester glycosidase family protein [Chthonomonadaceae bacterium]|nr:phosphodiester glycosidase family protein [Chthonomonadaceae bacterium]